MQRIIHIIVGFFKLFVARLLVTYQDNRDSPWLVCEKTNEARDNGLYFFLYSIEVKKKLNVFYIIDKSSYDFDRIAKYNNNIIFTDSFKHCIYYFKASKLISSQSIPFPFSEKLCKFFFRVKNQKYYWLQHGITKDKLNHQDMDRQHKEYSFVSCAAPAEAKFFCEEFGYSKSEAICTGFCRFDGLIDISTSNKIILIMPTFRKWLKTNKIIDHPTKIEEFDFKQSAYYKEYHALLTDKQLLSIIKESGTKVIFYQHYAFQCFSYLFDDCKSDSVIIADSMNYDVQLLMRKANILITDYSSVFFDFSYMKKPVIYYQFDELEYRNNHYKEGYFSYRKNGFGKVIVNHTDLVDEIISQLHRNFILEPFYDNRINLFFGRCDNNNTKRVYECISSI